MRAARLAPNDNGLIRLDARPGRRRSGLLAAILASALALPLAGWNGMAQGAPERSEGKGSYRLPPNLLRYLQEKYIAVDDLLVSTLRETPDGPLGHINIRGRITPRSAISGATREERGRSAARAFLTDEAALLGLADLSELREIALRTDGAGAVAIDFVRQIGDLQLLEVLVHITVGPDETITRVSATLRPASPALYAAVGRKTLSREEAIRIVERDLASAGLSGPIKILPDAGRFATWRPPYVVWGIAANVGEKPAWGYTIDAFSGAIIRKGCTAVTIMSSPGATPCD